MSMWILVIYIYAGMLSDSDSVAITTIPGFVSREACLKQAEYLKPLVGGSTKNIRTACIEQGAVERK